MTMRSRVKTRWIPGTRAYGQSVSLPVVNKSFTVDETTATLADYLNAYGYLVAKPGGENWLQGLVPTNQIERIAAIVREQLASAKPSTEGRALALK